MGNKRSSRSKHEKVDTEIDKTRKYTIKTKTSKNGKSKKESKKTSNLKKNN